MVNADTPQGHALDQQNGKLNSNLINANACLFVMKGNNELILMRNQHNSQSPEDAINITNAKFTCPRAKPRDDHFAKHDGKQQNTTVCPTGEQQLHQSTDTTNAGKYPNPLNSNHFDSSNLVNTIAQLQCDAIEQSIGDLTYDVQLKENDTKTILTKLINNTTQTMIIQKFPGILTSMTPKLKPILRIFPSIIPTDLLCLTPTTTQKIIRTLLSISTKRKT